ncbi:MAG: flagellar hook-length control protein FliK [Enterobacteriaceae bacterium]|jgi:flagellar hook-length control protein FliK|nr:flagellar hook-length control protein FliK [Enterobacteriaceae bacterium]
MIVNTQPIAPTETMRKHASSVDETTDFAAELGKKLLSGISSLTENDAGDTKHFSPEDENSMAGSPDNAAILSPLLTLLPEEMTPPNIDTSAMPAAKEGALDAENSVGLAATQLSAHQQNATLLMREAPLASAAPLSQATVFVPKTPRSVLTERVPVLKVAQTPAAIFINSFINSSLNSTIDSSNNTPDTLNKAGITDGEPLQIAKDDASAALMRDSGGSTHVFSSMAQHSLPMGSVKVTQTSSAVPVSPPTVSQGILAPEVGTTAWQQALGQQIACFTRDGVHHAELRLHPKELGALKISLRLNNDQAQLHFVTGDHQVRAALESAMPHLRTSLAESGVQLGQSSVGADTASSQESAHSEHGAWGMDKNDSADDEALIDEPALVSRMLSYSQEINTFV